MAPVRESSYFPPLDKCLDGRHQLFSWRNTYVGLKQLEQGTAYESLEKHLTDSHTLELLRQSFSPNPPATTQTKATFETKTSAINVVPSAQERYDIKQIQDDSLWLSATAKIDEVTALRLVILEWQTWPAARLQDSGPVGNVLAPGRSINQTGSISRSAFSASQTLLQSTTPLGGLAASDLWHDADARRRRLFNLYVTESRYRFEICSYLIFNTLCAVGDGKSSSHEVASMPEWVESIGQEILNAWDIHGVSKVTGKNIFLSALDAFKSRIRCLEEGCRWFPDKEEQESIQATWCEGQILEMLAVMEIMLVMLGALSRISRSDVVNSWYRLMSDYGFFEVFEPPFRDLYDTHEWQLQSLTSLISLAILRVPTALHMLKSLSASTGSVAESSGNAPYLLNADVCNEVTEILINASSECLCVPSPAVLAWGIILQTLREQVFQSREPRESRQTLTLSDESGMADSADNENPQQSSARTNMLSLRRHSSTGSDTPQQQTYLELLLERTLLVGVDGDPVAFLARAAVDGSRVLDIVISLSVGFCTPFGSDNKGKKGMKMRHTLLELIKASLNLVDYQPDLIQATLAVLTGSESYWDMLDRPLGYREAEPASIFLEDTTFMDKLFYEALYRFPYETLPFLRLCRALAVCFADQGEEGMPATWPMLSNTNTLTCGVPMSFTAYQLIRDDDEESTSVQLTASLDIFQQDHGLQPRFQKRAKQDGTLVSTQSMNLRRIPQGAIGKVLSEAKPLVVYWSHSYSPLAYLGMLLQSASSENTVISSGPSRAPTTPPELIPEIIDLLSISLQTACKGAVAPRASISAAEVTQGILDTASQGLEGGQDIISVVLDIFERELGQQPKSMEDMSFTTPVRCIQFIHVLLQVMPDRVWPFLGRSALLGVQDSNIQLSTLLASPDQIEGKYDLLIGCIRLFESLVDDAITHTVIRKNTTKAVARFAASQPLGAGVSHVVMKKVLLNFLRIMLDVYQSIPTWTFVQPSQRREVNARLSALFHRVLIYCYGVEDQPNDNQKSSAPLMPAAEHIIDAFLSAAGSESISAHLTSIIEDGAGAALYSGSQVTKYWIQQTIWTLNFASVLLRLNTLLGYPRSILEHHMLRSVSLLTRTYIRDPAFRRPVIELLDVLVQNASRTDSQPASLLGHMPEDDAVRFLEVLSLGDEPLRDRNLSVSLGKLLSKVVSSRQQWLAILVLTGEAPRKVLKRKQSESDKHARSNSLLRIALDRLSNIERLAPQTASAMLEFVAFAADSWPWILAVVEEHPHFLNAITEYVRQVETMSNTTLNRSSQAGMEYYKIQIASSIAEILAIYTHYTRQNGKASYAKELLPNLTYVATTAVVPPAFNASLHSNLRQNFEARFENCTTTAFKRTSLTPAILGDSFYYDTAIAGQMLRMDSSWSGRDNNGFAAEFARANINLSVVEAQISLFHSWRFLAVELSKSLKSDGEYQKTMAEAVIDCLRTNAQNTLPQTVFERLAQSRADLAFTLLQTLIDERSARPEVKSALFTAWDAMRAHGTDLAVVLDGDGAAYCRTLLKILCLSVQAHVPSSPASQDPANNHGTHRDDEQPKLSTANATLKTILEILRVIVAHGFRSLTTLLHSSPSRVVPSDFALLAAILRSSLLIPGLDRHTTALLSTFADAQTSRYASTLLSWSDQLATNRDPIYGELSINFLLEMSSLPALAESLAVEGILGHISDTNLIKFLRTGRGMGPFDQPARMYNIWTRGLLPLLLNLLHAVGASMAAEISVYLSQFGAQIARANAAFTFYSTLPAPTTATTTTGSGITAATGEGHLTLSTISEAQTLAVLMRILDAYRDAGPSAGVASAEIVDVGWDRARVKEDVESWLASARRGVLGERIVPSGEREEAWCRMKAMKGAGGSSNRLEEKAVEEMGVLGMLLGGEGEG